MCIRDRSIVMSFVVITIDPPRILLILALSFAFYAPVKFLLSLIHISEPHETKANLVCRLLLEKKKLKTCFFAYADLDHISSYDCINLA